MKSVLVVVAALLVSILTTSVNACDHGDVRLAGSYRTNPELEGRVEVCRSGIWGTVCDNGWSTSDANVVCRQLGHSSEGAVARYYAYYGQSYSLSARLTRVYCTGSESRLIDCSYYTPSYYRYSSSYCTYTDAGVKCLAGVSNNTVLERNITDNATDIEGIRLVNKDNVTSTNMGRLEVKYNGNWGTVCNDFWTIGDATVACRMLGFEDAVCAVTTNQFGSASNSTSFLMSDLRCTGTEDYLDSCDFAGWGSAYGCSHTSSDDAGVVCVQTSEIGTPYNIQLVNSSTTSITIKWNVPELPNNTQNASLRYYIGYSGPISGTYTTLEGTSRQVGDEVTMSFNYLTRDTKYTFRIRAEILYTPCSYTYASGNYSEPVSFRTNATLKRSTIPTRLVSPYPGVDFLGRIEVFYNNQWGTVCDDLFGTAEGNIVCQMLNFTKGAVCTAGYYSTYGRGTGPIWLDNVDCNPGVEVLEDCDHNGWGVNNCNHYSDVGVMCEPTLPPVKNLQVTAVSHTAVTLSWSEHSFPRGVSDSQYQILYKTHPEGVATTINVYSSSSQYTLRNLQFEKEYNISIRARMRYSFYCYTYIYGEYSNEVRTATMETAPDGPPTSFDLEVINSTAIEAMWNLPGIYNRNGFIRGYRLFVLNGGVQIRNKTIPNNDTLAYIVGGLQRSTAYTFSILAYTVADGPRSIHLTTTTLLYDPLIVGFGIYGSGVDKVTRYTYNQGFQVHCTTSRDPSITTTDWYFANGTKVGLIDANFREGYYPENKTTVLQIGLNRYISTCDGGNYTCVVKTNSTRTAKRSFRLIVGTSPPAPSRPTAVKIKSNSVTIQWSLSSCNGGHSPSSFRIRYKRTSSSSYYSYSYITLSNSTQRQYTITGLSTSTSYDFSVQATTVDARSTSYSTAATVVTLPPAPSAPRDISVKLVKPLVAEVSWRAPAVTNGVITHYTIYAIPQPSYEINFRRKRQTTTLPKTVKKVLPGTYTSGNITLSTQSITYQFRVSASSSFGLTPNEGELSSITVNATIYVPEQGLPTPSNLGFSETTTNSSITLTWEYPPPPVDTIESFFVTYSGDVEWRSPGGTLVRFKDSGELSVSGTTVTVSPLIPGTRYHFKVSVVTSTGRGGEESTYASTQMSQDKLAYFQLRMTPVYSCLEFSSPSLNLIDMVRSEIVDEINTDLCTDCRFTTANIRNHEFSCRGGITNYIVYRAMIIGTDTYSAPAIVSRIQSWVASGSASITALSTRLHLDKNCNASLDTLDEPDCLQQTATTTPAPVLPTTAPVLPTTVSKETVKTTTPKPEVKEPSVKPITAGQVGAGDIIGFLFGVIVIALLVVLIVIIVLIAVKRFRRKPTKSVSHQRMFASFSEIGSNRESVNLDDETKDDVDK